MVDGQGAQYYSSLTVDVPSRTLTALAGADMIMVGVIGEYVGRIYYEVKRRPHYLVKETTITVREEPRLTGPRTETRAVPGPGVTESS